MPKFQSPVGYTGPKATTTSLGQARFATVAEADAGDRDDLIISPATLDAAGDLLIPDATDTVKGKIRIATDAEAVAGVLDTVAMTPYTVGLIAIAGAPLASEVLAGIAELATQAETNTGTDDNRIVTPLKLTGRFASPPAIGGTTPAAGSFTTLGATGLATLSGSATITTGATALNVTLPVAAPGEAGSPFAITFFLAFGSKVGCKSVSKIFGSIRNKASSLVINFSPTISTAILIEAFAVLFPDLVCNIQSFLFSMVNSISCISR